MIFRIFNINNCLLKYNILILKNQLINGYNLVTIFAYIVEKTVLRIFPKIFFKIPFEGIRVDFSRQIADTM